jgi:2-(1,2-epoxy-1,2-dihydrophenyl)acetyl-CoA isomerase
MELIQFEMQDALAIIRLNRPEKLNAFTREMSLLLQKKLDDCIKENVRAVYITGNGKAFSAGQDLAEVTQTAAMGFDRILSEHYNPIILRIRNLEKPVIAAVNGVAAGAGVNIAICCDIVLATESASFVQAFSKIGLVPDSGGTYFLPRLIGWQKASALAMTGEKLTASEAERAGLIYKVYPDAEFEKSSLALATMLASMPTRALALTKKALSLSFNHSLEKQLEVEDLFQQQAAQTADYREGITAFLEKRKPLFKGA